MAGTLSYVHRYVMIMVKTLFFAVSLMITLSRFQVTMTTLRLAASSLVSTKRSMKIVQPVFGR